MPSGTVRSVRWGIKGPGSTGLSVQVATPGDQKGLNCGDRRRVPSWVLRHVRAEWPEEERLWGCQWERLWHCDMCAGLGCLSLWVCGCVLWTVWWCVIATLRVPATVSITVYVVWWVCDCNCYHVPVCVGMWSACPLGLSVWLCLMYVPLCVRVWGSCQLCDCDSRILSPGDLCEVWADYSPLTAVICFFLRHWDWAGCPILLWSPVPCVWWGMGLGMTSDLTSWSNKKTWCLTITFSSPSSTLLQVRCAEEKEGIHDELLQVMSKVCWGFPFAFLLLKVNA